MAQPTISGYTIGERLGSGGFASVYLATDDTSGQKVAIKVLHDHTSNPDDLRRFERERTTMHALSGHPNIVGVLDGGPTDTGDMHYTVLEYVEGGSVRDRLSAGGALHWANVVEIGVQICAALDVAHRSGVLHRDVKPANILLDDNIAKLTDFGIARLIGQSQVTAAQSIIGTLAYTPPEIFHNKPFDGRGDIYQLGISLYEMLLGRAPFTSAAADNKATIIRRILDNPAPPLAQFDVPQPISDLLDEVLAKDPADRPQTAESFGRRLNQVEVDLGRSPTYVGPDTQSIAVETATITDPKLGAQTASPNEPDPLWPAQADPGAPDAAPTEAASTQYVSTPPPAPDVEPPVDANITVVEPRPTSATSVIPSAPSMSLGTPGPAPSFYDEPTPAAPTPTAPEPSPRKKWPWIALLVLLIGAGGAGVAVAQLTGDDTGDAQPPITDDGVDTDDTDPGDTDGTDDTDGDGDTPDEPLPQFDAIDDPAFTEASGSDGVIFGSVANSFGLTMVGAYGDGESIGDQHSVVWTLEPGTVKMQREFDPASRTRLWSIGVIDGQQFLAVGEIAGAGETDGAAWIGQNARILTQVTDPSFSGNAKDRLRIATFDNGAGTDSYLVGGTRNLGGEPVLGLWEVDKGETPEDVTWNTVNVGSGTPGIINDIATTQDIAAAVGKETTGTREDGIILVRRTGEGWNNLIVPIPNAEFFGVIISGERIIAVGVEGGPNSKRPFAVVSDAAGNGQFHRLPTVDNAVGIAHDVDVVADGRVVAIGDIAVGDSRRGAIWELLPAAELADDRWTTRATPELAATGYTELWNINEYRDAIYLFGRTETEDRRPAGAWQLRLPELDS